MFNKLFRRFLDEKYKVSVRVPIGEEGDGWKNSDWFDVSLFDAVSHLMTRIEVLEKSVKELKQWVSRESGTIEEIRQYLLKESEKK